MKKIVLFLLAVIMVAGGAGCSGDDFSPTTSNMAGIYNFTKITVTDGGVTGTIIAPDVSGTIILTSIGTYTVDIRIGGDRTAGSGTYAISGDTIIIDNGDGIGPITDDGRKFSFTTVEGGTTGVFEFTRS